jgi:hypothetical protein
VVTVTNARPGTVAVQTLGDDDPAHGTGMIVLLKRRQDGRFDIYRPPGLALDPEHAQVGGDLGAWVEADIDPARFDISHDGVDVDVCFARWTATVTLGNERTLRSRWGRKGDRRDQSYRRLTA